MNMSADWLRDVRHGFRSMRRSPGFTAAAVLTLALGIGANTAIFSLIYALLLRSLPVAHPEELRFIHAQTKDGMASGAVAYPCYAMMRDQARSLAAVAGVQPVQGAVLVSVDGGDVEKLYRERVTASYFATLRLQPAAGRFFTPEEDTQTSAAVLISYNYFKRRFNLSPAAVGTKIALSGAPYTIVGVTPSGFTGITAERAADLWFPSSNIRGLGGRPCMNNPACNAFLLLARVRPGASDEQQAAELNGIFSQYLQLRARALPEPERRSTLESRIVLAHAGAGRSWVGTQLRVPLTVLMVLVGLVLLLGCVNLASMLLARNAARSRELTIRLALGAGRWRLLRQLLAESVVLALTGGAFGLVFAMWGASLLAREYGIAIGVGPDLRVLGFTAAVSLCSGLLFGLLPSLRGACGGLTPLMTNMAGRPGRLRAGRFLVVSQVALSIVLLVGAGLFLRVLAKLKAVDAGYGRQNLFTFSVVTPAGWRPQADPAIWRLLDHVRTLPGVLSASTASPAPPMAGPRFNIDIPGRGLGPSEDRSAFLSEVAESFFETVGTPLLEGRGITREDRGRKPRVAVVNATFARRFFGNSSPVGRVVEVQPLGPFEIVGVAADARYWHPKERPIPTIFPNTSQLFASGIVVRTAGDPRPLMAALPRLIPQAEPELRLFEIGTILDRTDSLLTRERMLADLAAFFGLVALLLAALGIYGVIAFGVGERTREIGIRVALGARRGSVVWMVLRETVGLLLAGLALGMVVIHNAGRWVSSLLFELTPADPPTVILAALLLSAVALLAGYLPVRRGARIAPVEALRCE